MSLESLHLASRRGRVRAGQGSIRDIRTFGAPRRACRTVRVQVERVIRAGCQGGVEARRAARRIVVEPQSPSAGVGRCRTGDTLGVVRIGADPRRDSQRQHISGSEGYRVKSSHATRTPFASLGFLVKPVTQCRRPEATGYPFFSSSTFTSNCVPWSSLLFSPNHNCTSSSAVSSDPNVSPKSRSSCTSALCHRDVVASGRQLDGAAIGVAGAVSQHRPGRWWSEKRGGLRPPLLQGHADRVVPGIQDEEVEPVSRRRRPRARGLREHRLKQLPWSPCRTGESSSRRAPAHPGPEPRCC